jgi:DNA-binding NarL/FixJ family response regulator
MAGHRPIVIISSSDIITTAFQSVLAEHHLQTTCLTDTSAFKQLRPVPLVLFLDDEALVGTNSASYQLHQIQQSLPATKIIILSMTCEPPYVWKLVEAGAKGYLYLRDRLVPRIPLIIEDVSKGGLYLSPTAQTALASIHYYRNLHLTNYQADVLRLMTQHWTAARIADELGRTTAAIYQVQKILREIFVVETNGQLVQKVNSLQLLEN